MNLFLVLAASAPSCHARKPPRASRQYFIPTACARDLPRLPDDDTRCTPRDTYNVTPASVAGYLRDKEIQNFFEKSCKSFQCKLMYCVTMSNRAAVNICMRMYTSGQYERYRWLVYLLELQFQVTKSFRFVIFENVNSHNRKVQVYNAFSDLCESVHKQSRVINVCGAERCP